MNYRFDKIAFNSTAKKTPTESDKEHYIGLEHIDSECLEITRWGSDVAPIGEKLIMKKGDVLFGKRRAYQRKLAIAPFDGIFSAHGMVLRPNEEVVDKNYFPFFMSSDLFMERAVQISVGGLSPTINWKDLREQEFPLPSLAEQKVLADKLWAAYRLKESYKKLLAATEEMVKSQFIEMFGNNKQTEKQGVLADFCTLKAGKSVKSGDISENYEEGLYPCYGGNGRRGYVSSYSHDGIYNIIGRQGALCGNVNIVNGKFYATEHAVVVTPKEQIAPHWLYFALSGMNLNQYARGVAQPGLAVNQLEQLPFTIPSMELQKQFVSIAHQADKSGFVGFKSQFIEMFGCLAERVALSSLCDTFIDGDWIEAKDQSGSGIRLIQTGNVGVGTFKEKGDRARYISEETFNRLNCTEVVEGDILISRLPEPVGRACIIPAGLGKSITAVDCTIIRLNDKVLPKFFVAFTNTPDYAMQIKKVLSGTTRLRVSRANLGKIQVPLPSIDKQQQFVTIAEQADKSGSVLQYRISC
jgi:type I restriction enzyme S subunit